MSADTPAQKRRASRAQIRKMKLRKAAGLCTVCGLPEAPGCSGACEEHRVARNQRTYEYRKRRLATDPAYRETVRLKAEEKTRRERDRNAFAGKLRDSGALLALCHVFGLELPSARNVESVIPVLRDAGRRLVAAMGETHRPGVRKPKIEGPTAALIGPYKMPPGTWLVAACADCEATGHPRVEATHERPVLDLARSAILWRPVCLAHGRTEMVRSRVTNAAG